VRTVADFQAECQRNDELLTALEQQQNSTEEEQK
jgi:hypothetical protein